MHRFSPRFILAMMLAATPLVAQENPILDELVQVGVPLDEETNIKLPPPALKDGLNPTEEQEILDGLRGNRPLSEFLRDSRVASFNLKLSSHKNQEGKRTGQTIDLYFVCYGELATIEENKLIEQLGSLDESDLEVAGGERLLSNEDLQSRKIEPSPCLDERYAFLSGPILKRVRVSGVIRSVISRQDSHVVLASILDKRFSSDRQFPNQWQSQSRDNRGKTVLGTAQPYDGYGGYARATQLQQPEGAILVEIHVAFKEPHGWFNGANLLRSKLPLIVQNKVREFRGRLAKLKD